jgi:hypothetical protein
VSVDSLPAEVVRFLNDRISSVPHLEALLIIWESNAAWSAQQLSARLYLDESATRVVLDDLQRQGLLLSEDGVRFGFDARPAGAHAMMHLLARTYERNIARVATLIHSNAASSVREFARAFEFKKDR